jgi:hypothetical protein
MSTAAQELAVPAEIHQPGPRVTLRVLRISAALHGLAVLAQPVLAGAYLSGDVDALVFHAINADTAAAFGVFQLIAAIVFVWKGRGRPWAIWATLGIVLAEQVQIPIGLEGVLAVHIPLGVSIVSMQILLTVWLFRANARLPRAGRRAR